MPRGAPAVAWRRRVALFVEKLICSSGGLSFDCFEAPRRVGRGCAVTCDLTIFDYL